MKILKALNYILIAVCVAAISAGCGGGSSKSSSCGNGIMEASEQCDDSNLASGDGCSQVCSVETGQSVFARTYSAISNYSIQNDVSGAQTADGGYIITGNAEASTTFPVIIRTSSTGESKWTKTFNCYCKASSVVATSDGGSVFAGNYTRSSGGSTLNSGIWAVKLDENGTELWRNSYGTSQSDQAYDIIQTSDNGFAMAARIGNYNSSIIKTNSSGVQEWRYDIGDGKNSYYAQSIEQASNGDYIISGYYREFQNSSGTNLFWAMRINSTRTRKIWEFINDKTEYGNSAYDSIATSDGGALIAGTVNFYYSDMHAIKLDSNGNAVWRRSLGDTYYSDQARSIAMFNDGSFMLAGTNGSDAYFARLGPSGNLIFGKTLGWNDSYEYINKIIRTSDGGFAAFGSARSKNSYLYSILFIKMDSLGNCENCF